MKTDTKADNDHMLQRENCTYQPLYNRVDGFDASANECQCTPPITQEQCRCAGLSNRRARESLAKRSKRPKQRGLIAYLRDSGAGLGLEQQRKVIDDYCQDNEYYVKAAFVDEGKSSTGLQAAMKAVGDADGLIASDLNRFVEHHSDRLRDLRPFMHHFFCHAEKHLISVEEGVDTGSCAGQANAIELMNQVKELY